MVDCCPVLWSWYTGYCVLLRDNADTMGEIGWVLIWLQQNVAYLGGGELIQETTREDASRLPGRKPEDATFLVAPPHHHFTDKITNQELSIPCQ